MVACDGSLERGTVTIAAGGNRISKQRELGADRFVLVRPVGGATTAGQLLRECIGRIGVCIAGRVKAHLERPVGSRLAAQLEAGAQQDCTIELAHPRQQAKVGQQHADDKVARC